ncbi:nicastrin family protein [Trichuris trichiura]|uniref:Nicastrin n=1 Tax=Trichuris trichiura TaxID=36087 RepID=A0A077YVT0_TRITR|nr:nicastrin family protein [Trichuris trichiura]
MLNKLSLWILLVTAGNLSCASRVRDKIYINLEDGYPCTRLLNSTHQVGCHSSKGGNVGIVFWARTQKDFAFVLNDTFNLAPYVIVAHARVFSHINSELLEKLRNKLAGAIIYFEESGTSTEVPSYSEDDKCPSSTHDLYAKDSTYGQCHMAEWNKPGRGSRFLDWNIPVYLLVNQTEINLITQECFVKHNEGYNGADKGYPLCAAELVTFNHAAGDAVRCLRRNDIPKFLTVGNLFCLPLEELNVFFILPFRERESDFQEKSIFLLAARMDSLSLFNDYSPGTTSVGSVIVWLAVAEALGRSTTLINELSNKTNRHLMPVLFHGEAFDYIGSSRMVWDMQKNTFPPQENVLNSSYVNLSHIGFLFELSHITDSDSGQLYLHVDPSSYKNHSKTKDAIDEFRALLHNTFSSISDFKSDLPLPPSSLHSFLKIDRSIPGTVISDYQKEFSSRFYNSFLDLPFRIQNPVFKELAVKLGNATLNVMFNWLNNGSSVQDVPSIDEKIVTSLIDCFKTWPEWNCTIFERIMETLTDEEKALFDNRLKKYSRERTYIHLRRSRPSMIRLLASYLAEYFVGTKNCSNETSRESCENQKDPSCFYMPDLLAPSGQQALDCCLCTHVMYSPAKSPAFAMEDHDIVTSNYSTWVESVFSITTMRLFLVTSSKWQLAILLSGIVVFLFWLVIVWLIVKHLNTLFETTTKTEDRLAPINYAVAAYES